MTKYIAFLRAVNVGGRTVKMDELKLIFALPGFNNISTYIQSGNVLFETKESNKKTLQKKIETALEKALGYEVTTILKTPEELQQIIKNNPFSKKMEGKDLYISLMASAPGKEHIAQFEALKGTGEELHVAGTETYILCPVKTYGNSKLSNATLEIKLKVKATTRNWATMNKLAAGQ